MKHKSLLVALLGAAFALAGAPMIAGAGDEDVEEAKRNLDKIMQEYSSATLAEAFRNIGIIFPNSAGFRGLQYSEYLFGRNCWIRGPQAGLIRNDNCITYKATCDLRAGGSKLTVTKLSGDKHIRVYDNDREVFACEATIHLPQEEGQVFTPIEPIGTAEPR